MSFRPSAGRLTGTVAAIGTDGATFSTTGDPSPAVTRSLSDSGAGTAQAPAIEITNLTFGFPDAAPVITDMSLTVGTGEIVVLIGPSGCGKSTLLNLVAGLLRAPEASVDCFGKPVAGLNHHVTYMTQKDTLLPWRTGIDNAALPLEIKGVPKKERHVRARAVMAEVGVADAESRRPHQLSGGMRARLSVARALLSDTEILLLDEPFAAVDALRRIRLQQMILQIWQDTRKTIMYVTHDLDEAVVLGHRVIVMSAGGGRILLERKISAPQPRSVARFVSEPEAQAARRELWDALESQSRD